MEMRPGNREEVVPSPQPPLFIENIPQRAEDLTEANMRDLDSFLSPKLILNPDGTISGYRYGLLSIFASQHGISDEVLKKYLSSREVVIDSKLPPEKPFGSARVH